MHSAALFSDKGFPLVSISAKLDNKEECMFVDYENGKTLLFRSPGTFMYTVRNNNEKPVYFVLTDEHGRINSADYLSPYSEVNIHNHKSLNKLLETLSAETEFTVFNVSGKWKLCEDDEDNIDEGIEPEGVVESVIKKVKEDLDLTYEISDDVAKSIDMNVSASFTFKHLLRDDIIFLSYEPSRILSPKYVEKKCAICLEDENETDKFCTFIKCGHKCTHLLCLLKWDKNTWFKKCPLCRVTFCGIIP